MPDTPMKANPAFVQSLTAIARVIKEATEAQERMRRQIREAMSASATILCGDLPISHDDAVQASAVAVAEIYNPQNPEDVYEWLMTICTSDPAPEDDAEVYDLTKRPRKKPPVV